MHKSVADVTGRVIQVGDWVAYAVGTTNYSLRIAKVMDLEPYDVLRWDRNSSTEVFDYSTDKVKVRSFIAEKEWDSNLRQYTGIVNYRKNNQKFKEGDRFIVLDKAPDNIDPTLWD